MPISSLSSLASVCRAAMVSCGTATSRAGVNPERRLRGNWVIFEDQLRNSQSSASLDLRHRREHSQSHWCFDLPPVQASIPGFRWQFRG
ncbi:hypothetical protein BD413DRAFT_533278 [Trametes elegans]|nr:hypothetical protein BD413DRAFT_533278 [Trametes elegans]